uniref:Hsp20 n=1 Tax=Tigriopus kingsejongensis TaxID=1133412 RepID=A0A1L3THV9_9MAXI|nr:Hsp20 [Tigriopus kingsejongensis]
MSRDIVPTKRDPFFKDPFFSSTWDEFEKMRQDMMVKSKEFWGNMDQDFANFDDEIRKTHSDMDRQMMPSMPQLPRWAIPEDLKPKWSPMLTSATHDEVLKVKEGQDKFEVTVDVSQFKPEELKVTTNNNVLSIEGKHEEAKSDPNNSSSVMRQFSRKWTLPEDCQANEVVSNLSSDGILLVTAPRKAALSQDATKSIK